MLEGQFTITAIDEASDLPQRCPEAVAIMAYLTDNEPRATLEHLAVLARTRPQLFLLGIGPDNDPALIQAAVNEGHCDAYLTAASSGAELAAMLTRGIVFASKRGSTTTDSTPTPSDPGELKASLAACQAQLAEAHQRLRDTRHEVLQLELQASITQLVRGLAHELNNPLSAILGHSQRLRLRADDPQDVRHRADILGGEAERCIALVERLRSFGAPLREEALTCSIGTVIGLACERLEQRRLTIPPIAYRQSLPPVIAPQRALARCIEQVIDNAIQEQATQLWIDGEERGGRIHVSIDNNGRSPTDEEIRHAIRPFFTTRSQEGHHGLGLSLASSLIREMGGSISLDRLPNESGARCTLSLPAATPSADITPTRALPVLQDATEILVVDDEPMVAELLGDLVTDLGHQATICATRQEALEKLRSGSPRAMLLDVKLPDGDGIELLSLALRRWPRLVGHCALITGNPHDEQVQLQAAELGAPLLAKPFQLARIQQELLKLL